MARNSPTGRAARTLIWFFVLVGVLAGIVGAGSIWSDAQWTPKLALDLEGGTEIILEAQPTEGETVTPDQLQQSVAIIRQRVDASGVSEAEISTQGDRNIVVALPGQPDQETIDRIEQAARLDFRAVLYYDAPTGRYDAKPAADDAQPDNGSSLDYITRDVKQQFNDLTECTQASAEAATEVPADEALVTCDDTGTIKYILGPIEVSGDTISNATSGLLTTNTGATTGEWAVDLEFNPQGTKEFAAISERLVKLTGAQNQFAVVLDGFVITAPTMNAAIQDGRAQISGSFTQESAEALAQQLRFGALPVTFAVQSNDTVSATLGAAQLQASLIAGLIGFLLVIAYSIVQYRALSAVTIASLLVGAGLTYLILLFLSWRFGYRLSLAGVTGAIVAVGITADSFIVYFERVRDELRDGKSLASAVHNGWRRAFRTITASDAVNFLAAVVLYILAIGNVRGFAFTLGVTTIVDLLVVTMFTYPLVTLVSRWKFFSEGHRFSGLDPQALGAVYRGRAQFRAPTGVPKTKAAASSREAARRQTIAERKAAEAASSSPAARSSSAPASPAPASTAVSATTTKRRSRGHAPEGSDD